MPTRAEIYGKIASRVTTEPDRVRHQYVRRLADYTRRDTILLASGFLDPQVSASSYYGISTGDVQSFMAALHRLKGTQLDIVLHSPGGELAATEQIVEYLRAKYTHIRAIVPQLAMSAATLLCCACDEIVMGKHSAIGPIDPQFYVPSSIAPPGWVAAQVILDEYRRAKSEIVQSPQMADYWQMRLLGLPFGLLSECERAITLSEERAASWLAKYMFGLSKEDGLPKEATAESLEKARQLATWLGSADEHKDHGRPISARMARDRGIAVVQLEDDQELQERVLSVFHASMATFRFTRQVKLVENHLGRGDRVSVA